MLARLALALWILASLAGLPPAAEAQITTLPVPDSVTATSFYGATVALDGDRALVGAPGTTTCGDHGGAVYLYERVSEGHWRLEARLVPDDCRPNAFFGRSIALSGDRAIVGAVTEFFATEASNVAYVFERLPDGTWHQAARLTVDPRHAEGVFAATVDLDGTRALVTTQGDPPTGRRSPFRGAAYVFERQDDGTWRQAARLFGRARGAGAFGSSAALDGNRLVVAASARVAYRPGAAYVFERLPDGTWHEAAYLADLQGAFIEVDVDGDRLLVGESRRGRTEGGAATLYARRDDGAWQRSTVLRPSTPYAPGAFGTAVSLSGSRALVVGYDEQLGMEFNIDRVVYVFGPRGERWRQRQVVDVGAVDFGAAVAHDGATALVSHTPDEAPGVVYVVGLR